MVFCKKMFLEFSQNPQENISDSLFDEKFRARIKCVFA